MEPTSLSHLRTPTLIIALQSPGDFDESVRLEPTAGPPAKATSILTLILHDGKLVEILTSYKLVKEPLYVSK